MKRKRNERKDHIRAPSSTREIRMRATPTFEGYAQTVQLLLKDVLVFETNGAAVGQLELRGVGTMYCLGVNSA